MRFGVRFSAIDIAGSHHAVHHPTVEIGFLSWIAGPRLDQRFDIVVLARLGHGRNQIRIAMPQIALSADRVGEGERILRVFRAPGLDHEKMAISIGEQTRRLHVIGRVGQMALRDCNQRRILRKAAIIAARIDAAQKTRAQVHTLLDRGCGLCRIAQLLMGQRENAVIAIEADRADGLSSWPHHRWGELVDRGFERCGRRRRAGFGLRVRGREIVLDIGHAAQQHRRRRQAIFGQAQPGAQHLGRLVQSDGRGNRVTRGAGNVHALGGIAAQDYGRGEFVL